MYSVSYLTGVALFNRGDWFEAHEAWEDAWRESIGAERDFYQGLIQLAVGLCHHFNGNPRGATRLYHNARARLEAHGPRHLGIDVERLLDDMATSFAPALAADKDEWMSGHEVAALTLTLDPPPPEWPELPVNDADGEADA